MKKSLLYIGNKLSGKGSNVTTIETLGRLLSSEGCRVAYASEKQNQLLRLLDMLWKTFLLRKKVDYVLIDTYSTSGFWFAYLTGQLCRLLGKKYIPILHGGNLPNRLQNNPALCRQLFGNAYRNVAPSHYLLHEFQEAGFTNVTFIPNSIEIKKYPFKERSVFQPNLLWVRALAPIYNPKMAIDVLSELKRNYPDSQLCMVGPDKDRYGEAIKHYANEKGLDVKFTGRLPKESWISLSGDYDIFINTTHLDNTPVSIMEAMALGLPVVSTNVGGIPYLLTHEKDALLVGDNEVSEMTTAILKLAEDATLARKLSLNGRAKAAAWDWQSVKESWMALLQ